MKISAQEEYGLRCILQLASAPSGESCTVAEIAKREGISVAYAEKLLRILSKAGLTQSLRGVKGGYTLARPPQQITLGDVGRALGGLQTQEDICHRFTGNMNTCIHDNGCEIRPIWQGITRYVLEVMDGIRISEVLAKKGLIQLPSGTSAAALPLCR